MNHFLDIHKTAPADLRAMIDNAQAMKTARNGRPKGSPDDETPLKGRMVALIFEKPSTRTRVSFDVGVRQMGGETMVLSGKEMQLGHGESIDVGERGLVAQVHHGGHHHEHRQGDRCGRADAARPLLPPPPRQGLVLGEQHPRPPSRPLPHHGMITPPPSTGNPARRRAGERSRSSLVSAARARGRRRPGGRG